MKKNLKDSEKINVLRKERERLRRELAVVEQELLNLNAFPIEHLDWKQKAIDFLHKENGYIQSARVLDWVFMHEPGKLSNSTLRRKYITALSVALNGLNKGGIVKKFRMPNIQGDFYGLPSWFTKDGSLKKEYYGDKLNQLYEGTILPFKAR